MKIVFQMPPRTLKHYDEWIGERVLTDLAEAAERAGLDAIAMTEHPFPPDSWIDAGGHHSFDPFVALSIMAGRTTQLRLLTNLAVAAYRSPWMLAKAAASLDLLSGGRMVLGMGAGYVTEEFAALGADHAGRGPLFDATIDAMRAAWTGGSVRIADGPFAISGHTQLPTPVPREGRIGPPIWIGGNSARARRRVAEKGDGWLPFEQEARQAEITGTDELSDDALAEHIDGIREARRERGNDDEFEVVFAPRTERAGTSAEAFLAALENRGPAWRTAGVTGLTWQCFARSADAAMSEIEAVGAGLAAMNS
jgi:probable F420-dependent oxidoreductase